MIQIYNNEVRRYSMMVCRFENDSRCTISIINRIIFPPNSLVYTFVSFDVISNNYNIIFPFNRVRIRTMHNNISIEYSLYDVDEIRLFNSDEITHIPNTRCVYHNPDEENCIVCMERKKDTILYPCGHFYLCRVCSTNTNRCVICRAEAKIALLNTFIIF